jgi:hypothetical protein
MASKRDTWLIQVRAQRAAATALTLLAREGIDALPVKGIVTSRTLYADVAERVLTDVDLKVRPEDFRRLVRLVRREGLPVRQLMWTYGNVVFELDGVMIDVETHPSAPFTCALTVDQMIRRATPSDVLGVPHLVPDWYDHAIVLLLNVFKDKMVHAFRWAVQDLELLPTCPEFDESKLVARLSTVRAASAAAVASSWLAVERNSAAWSSVATALLRAGARPRFVERQLWILRRLPHDALLVRLHSRASADSVLLRTQALATSLAWTAEVQLAAESRRHQRQVLPPEVLVTRSVRDP